MPGDGRRATRTGIHAVASASRAGLPKRRLVTRLMIVALCESIAFVGGGSVCMENGLLGMPSMSRRTQAVYFEEAGEVLRGDLAGVFAELFGEEFCVVAADLEGDDGADVAEDGVGGGLVLGELKSGDCPSHSVPGGIVADGRQSETAVGRDSQGIHLSPGIRPVRDD